MVFDLAGQTFSLTLEQISALGLVQAFMLAAGALLSFIILAALAALAGRWLAHSIDKVFEWLLLMALGAALAWLFLRGGSL